MVDLWMQNERDVCIPHFPIMTRIEKMQWFLAGLQDNAMEEDEEDNVVLEVTKNGTFSNKSLYGSKKGRAFPFKSRLRMCGFL